jgi:hypothetical protein
MTTYVGKRLFAGIPPLLLLLLVLLGLAGCAPKRESVAVAREQLFTMAYGKAEDQLDLFQVDASRAPLKTRLAMREGIFYIANGPSAKVLRLSSFGDVLSMLYNPDKNPQPLLLKSGSESGAAAGRRAVQYPFRAVGEVAVDSRQTVYVEDRLPAERRVYDKDIDAVLDHVVLRFDKDGNSLDYLGQEGLGGTPFPFIQGMYITANDDCVVISLTQTAWLVDWFDARGFVKHSMKISRASLPQPEGEKGLIASLDRISPDSDGRFLVVKIDYYRTAFDPKTKSDSGVEFASSWAFHMDPASGSISDRWQIPDVEKTVKGNAEDGPQKSVRIPEYLGMADHRLFFLSADEGDKSQVFVYDTTTRSTSRFTITMAPEELFFSTMYLSPDGVLSAILGTKYEARVVWWRFDKLLGGKGKDSTQ